MSRQRLTTLALALAAPIIQMAIVLPAPAHHSFSALYLDEEEVSIEGRIVKLAIRNPHSFVHVRVTDQSGVSATWLIEWSAATVIGRLSRESLKPGDEVIVVGNPSRTQGNTQMKMVSITRPADGWSWQGRVE